MHTTVTSHTYIHDKTLEGSGMEKEGKTSIQHVEMNKIKSESLKKEEKYPGEKSIEAKECKTCVKQFKSPCIYINHYREEHGSVPPEYIDKELFFCKNLIQYCRLCTVIYYPGLDTFFRCIDNKTHGKKIPRKKTPRIKKH